MLSSLSFHKRDLHRYTRAQMIKPFAGYKVGRSAPPDPYNVMGSNLWRDRTR